MPKYGWGGGDGALAINNLHIFTTSANRDTYFATNPAEIKEDLYISVGGVLQKWTSASWVDASAVIRGQDGAPGDDMQIQYSPDGLNGWVATLDPDNHFYWRWSIDGGATWVPSAPATAKFATNSGAYNQRQIKTIHDDTAIEGFFGIDNVGIYWNDGAE